VLTGHIYRQPDRTHLVRVNPPHRVDPGWDEETAVARLTESQARELERAVRRAPESYFWVHRRWKTRPEDAATS
jgi:KDO2-lipid IV(A) lauroyltransferase